MVAAPAGVVTYFCNVGIYDPSKETTKPPKPATPPPKHDPCACRCACVRVGWGWG